MNVNFTAKLSKANLKYTENAGKYRPEITPYLDTFYAAFIIYLQNNPNLRIVFITFLMLSCLMLKLD